MLVLALGVSMPSQAAVTQTFEPGEDTSNWGSSGWSNLNTNSSGFLDPSLGGSTAGASNGQQLCKRDFRNNTDGLNLDASYSLSMYFQIDAPNPRTNFEFQAYDGNNGNEYAAIARVNNNLQWQVGGANGSWTNIGLTMVDNAFYRVIFNVDPNIRRYDVTVARVSSTGEVIESASIENRPSNQNIFQNNNNGQLGFFLQTQNNPSFKVDNINIQQGDQVIPEPHSLTLLLIPSCYLLRRRRREPSRS
jgi:hypothetical protein